MNIAKIYTDGVKKHFVVYYANWEPGSQIALGDYGTLNGNIFIPKGKLGIDFPEFKDSLLNTTDDDTKDQKEFKSSKGVDVTLLPKGTVTVGGKVLAKAALDIKFSSGKMIYFNAMGCTNTRITSKNKLGEALKEKYLTGKWDKDLYVVTDLVKSEKALIAISKSGSSGISFEADSPLLDQIDLADASIKLKLTSEKDIGYKLIADEGLYILIGLSKLKSQFLTNSYELNQRRSEDKFTNDDSDSLRKIIGSELIFKQMETE